jgi:hypothetical protein
VSLVADHDIRISEETIAQLQAFLREPKFRGTDFYTEPDVPVRDHAESLLNEFVQRFMDLGPGKYAKSKILQELKTTLRAFDRFDSEEQDQLMTHLDRPLDILSIESTDGLIGEWRYGSFESANDP